MEKTISTHFNSILLKQLSNVNPKRTNPYFYDSPSYPKLTNAFSHYSNSNNNSNSSIGLNSIASPEYNEMTLIDENYKIKAILTQKNNEYRLLKSEYNSLQDELDSCYKTMQSPFLCGRSDTLSSALQRPA